MRAGLWIAVIVVACLLSPTPGIARPESSTVAVARAAPASVRAADPGTWGLYSRLVGATLEGKLDAHYSWAWGQGEEIIESHGPTARLHITPDGAGTLSMYREDEPRSQVWTGQFNSADEVIWTLPRRPWAFRMRRDGPDILLDEVYLEDGRVAASKSPFRLTGRLAEPWLAPIPLLPAGKAMSFAGSAPFALHAIEGGAGATVHATLGLPGAGALTLFEPSGAPMLSVEGRGEVKLDAVLPLDRLFYLAVVRGDTAQPYTLGVTLDEPDLHLAVFSSGVGYVSTTVDERTGQVVQARSCWLEPGITLRRIRPSGSVDVTLGRGGKEVESASTSSGKRITAEWELQVDGDRITRHALSGSMPDQALDMDQVFWAPDIGRFHAYRCDAGDH